MQKLTIPQAAVIGVLNHYQLIERRIAETKAHVQQLKRQPRPELSARQQRKADKERRRAARIATGELTEKDMKHATGITGMWFDESTEIPAEAWNKLKSGS